MKLLVHQLRTSCADPVIPIEGNVIIVPVAGITKVVENSINYAKSLSVGQIIAVHVAFDKEEEKTFEEKWKQWQPDVRLSYVIFPIPKYHSATFKILRYC